MILGFIGTGGITESIVSGLYNHGGHREQILISKRSSHRSERLAAKFELIEVHDNNQDIVDQSDWIVLAVLPAQVKDVLASLRFRRHQKIVSLAAGISVESLLPQVSPADHVYRAIPMPPIEIGEGPTPVFPPDEEVESLFSKIGTAVAVTDEHQFTALAASSAIMATFFAWVSSNATWLEGQGVPAKQSALYTTSVFHALATLARQADPAELKQMSEDCLTPGGLNEQVLRNCQQAGVIDSIQTEIDHVMTRISG